MERMTWVWDGNQLNGRTEGVGWQKEKKQVSGMKNHVCLKHHASPFQLSDWLTQVGSRKNTGIHLSHNRRQFHNGVTIDTVLINVNTVIKANNCLFFNGKCLHCRSDSWIYANSTAYVWFQTEGAMKKMDTPIFATDNNNINTLCAEKKKTYSNLEWMKWEKLEKGKR